MKKWYVLIVMFVFINVCDAKIWGKISKKLPSKKSLKEDINVALHESQIAAKEALYTLGIKKLNIPKKLSTKRRAQLAELYETPDTRINSNDLRIMTFNIRYNSRQDKKERDWWKRLPRIVEMIRYYEPDVIGIQELDTLQRRWLMKYLKGYEIYGREKDNKNSYYLSGSEPLLYKKSRIQKLAGDTFWLSKEKQEYTTSWGANNLHTCTWGHFKDKKTGKKFWVFSTHLDVKSKKSRINSIELIINELKKMIRDSNEIGFIMGDFNDFQISTSTGTTRPVISKARELGVNDTRKLTRKKMGPTNTFTDWHAKPIRLLDFILINRSKNDKDFAIDQSVVAFYKNADKKPISDHLPVFIDVKL